MKKIICFIMPFLLFSTVVLAKPTPFLIQGKAYTLDTQTDYKGNSTLVEARAFAEALGANTYSLPPQAGASNPIVEMIMVGKLGTSDYSFYKEDLNYIKEYGKLSSRGGIINGKSYVSLANTALGMRLSVKYENGKYILNTFAVEMLDDEEYRTEIKEFYNDLSNIRKKFSKAITEFKIPKTLTKQQAEFLNMYDHKEQVKSLSQPFEAIQKDLEAATEKYGWLFYGVAPNGHDLEHVGYIRSSHYLMSYLSHLCSSIVSDLDSFAESPTWKVDFYGLKNTNRLAVYQKMIDDRYTEFLNEQKSASVQ